MKNNIKDGDKPWTAVSSIEIKCDGIKVDIYDGNTKGFAFGRYDYELLRSLYSTMIGVTDSSKVVEELGCK